RRQGPTGMAEGRRLRPALARRDRDAALQDHHRPNAPRPDSARTKGRGQGRLQGAQPHDRSRHARLSKARLKPPGAPPLPPDLRLCTNAPSRLAELAAADRESPLFGAGNVGVVARAGRLHRKDDESRSESYGDILARAGLAEIDGWGKGVRDPAAVGDHALQAHGAVFAEVKVDPDLGQVRVTRLIGAFAAGRIINPRLVLSQLYGGMIWGVSFALHEAASI